jgi:predicted RNA-binding Zn ribbon-like protein
VSYADYIVNVTQLAVDLVNDEIRSGLLGEMLAEHHVAAPADDQLGALMPALRDAVAAVADRGPIDPVNDLLRSFPPDPHVSDHDGEPHLHFARNGADPGDWLGRSCAAALAHVICGDPAVTVGRCQASGCARFYVDSSRNRSRRFCGNACASRTTVAAYRARQMAR